MNLPATARVAPRPTHDPTRRRVVRWAIGTLCLALGVLPCAESRADTGVPLALQVRLLGRLGPYDRNFKSRAGAVANILVVSRKGDADAAFERSSLVRAFADVRDIGGVPIHVSEMDFTDVDALARRCRTDRIAVLYLTVGLEGELPRLAAALASTSILTVGTTARHAENGAVLGFSLEEARPPPDHQPAACPRAAGRVQGRSAGAGPGPRLSSEARFQSNRTRSHSVSTSGAFEYSSTARVSERSTDTEISPRRVAKQ